MTERPTSAVEAPAPDRARRSLSAGVAVFRWLAFAWMVIGNLVEPEPFVRPELAWTAIGVAGAWTLFVTGARARRSEAVQILDISLAIGIVLLSGYVVAPGSVLEQRLFFAATFPLGAALALGETRGPWGGVVATLTLGIALFFSRLVNGVAVAELSGRDIAAIANGAASYLLAGLAGGFTARYLERWTAEHRALQEAAFRAQDRAVRLAERETLARRIHDSVLQALTMIAKRGTELARADAIEAAEVEQLAQMAKRQEAELRALVLRAPEEAPTGQASLRDALEGAARACTEVPVSVSAVGPLWLPAHVAAEVGAAVGQALRNVEQHAEASRAVIFAEVADGVLAVSVRDDGRGFAYQEAALRDAGKAGILRSIKGRIEDLGGELLIDSSAGAGTEVVLRLRLDQVVPSRGDLR